MNRSVLILTLTLGLSAWSLMAQDEGGPPGGGGGPPGRGGGFGGGRGNFDPTQFQQLLLDNTCEQLGVTSDEEWTSLKPLVQKVLDAQQTVQAFGGRGGRGGPGGFGGPGGGRGGAGGATANPAVQALHTAIDSGSTDQIAAAAAKFREARQQAQATLMSAQDALKKVLSVKQEAIALRMGLVN